MKNMYRRLTLASKKFDVGQFYAIRFDFTEITAQGRFDAKIARYCATHKFTSTVDSNGHITFTRGVYRVVLTD